MVNFLNSIRFYLQLTVVTISRIFMKLENLQPSGSFKSRGIGNLVLTEIARRKESGSTKPLHFYSSSGGNAGLAAVTAAVSLDRKATVVTPMTTPQMMVEKLRTAGATEVIQHGAMWAEADQYMREVVIPNAASSGDECVYITPFDHPAIWQGASSMITEIRRQMPDDEKPDAIICSVGGGGLFAGIMQGLDREGWDDVKVLAIETFGANSLDTALRRGELVSLPGISSIVTSLGAARVARQAFEQAQRKNVRSVVIDDSVACMGCWRFLDDERILVEPACGASMSMCYDGRMKNLIQGLNENSKVVVVVCGGSITSLDIMNSYREKYGEKAKGLGEQVPQTYTPPEY